MVHRADNQNSRATPKLSVPNWPTPDFFQEAKRARGKALREMIVAFCRMIIQQKPRASGSLMNRERARGSRSGRI